MSTLTVRLEQKTHVGAGVRADAVRATTDHIPGWTVRGAFAAAWIRRYGAPEQAHPRRAEFVKFFEGGVRFGPLYPDGEPPVSLALLGHKYPPQPTCDPVDIDCAVSTMPTQPCQGCGMPYEPQRGLRNRLAVTRRAGLQIGAEGVAVPGPLFMIESLPVGATLTGQIIGDTADLAALADLPGLRIGGRRTTHGQARPAITADTSVVPPQVISRRRFVIRLASPAVFVDGSGRPLPHPSPRELSTHLGAAVSVTRSWYRWERVGGWHAASGLPKPMETAVAAGSTYVCEADADLDPQALTRFADRGVGLRRHEGFGHLAGPTPLTLTAAQRTTIEQRISAARNNNQVPAAFFSALTDYADGLPSGPVDQLITDLHRSDPQTATMLRKLADAPRPELRRILSQDTP